MFHILVDRMVVCVCNLLIQLTLDYFQSNVEKHTLAKYLMELTLVDYDMVHYRPSEIAAASLCLSQLLLEDLPWVRSLFPQSVRGPQPQPRVLKRVSPAVAHTAPLRLL